MKRIRTIGIATLFLGLTAFTAQNNNDKAAEKLLKEVSKKYKSYKTITAGFSVTTETTQNNTQKPQSGSIKIKGDRFRFTFAGEEIFCNGKFIWTYRKETSECTKDKYNPKAAGINPAEIFSLWEKGFIYKGEGNYTKSGVTYEKIKLTPKDKKKPYFLINLEINSQKKHIESTRISFKNGNKLTYKVNSLTPNTKIEDSYFEFNAADYPGVTVVDLTN
jgi:outer membrane lipoprotein-sorting protein